MFDVLKARTVIEKTYTDTCNIKKYTSEIQPNHTTLQVLSTINSNVPCRIGFANVSSGTDENGIGTSYQIIKLFINPELVIDEGSIIEITRQGRTEQYKQSGSAALYPTHQEITLNLYEIRN